MGDSGVLLLLLWIYMLDIGVWVRDVVPDMIIGHMSRARVGLLIM
jgi:hypothetical protein